MRPPLLVVFLLSLGAAARAVQPPEKSPRVPVLPKTAAATAADVKIDAAFAGQLSALGWTASRDGSLSGPDGARVPVSVLKNASFLWRGGVIVYDTTFQPVDSGKLGPILRGLSVFSEAAAMDPKAAGRALAAWGIPPAYDGNPILNPDGSATYYGLMLYQYYVKSPDMLKRLSQERLAQALSRFKDAYNQAFTLQAPDIAYDELALVWDRILGAPARAGEQTLNLQPYPDLGATLAKYRAEIQADAASPGVAADPARLAGDRSALAVLNTLKTQRYAANESIVPAPDSAATPAAKAVALSGGMPGLLKTLDRINGRPLTPEQQKALIESFPMGELVWRMGVQNLWRQGLTGQGVKVAVIDQGVAPHPELDAAIASRQNFTADRGAALAGDHGTHVSGIIHQLAPDAKINSYIVFPADNAGNPKLVQDNDPGIRAAIRKAVSDGNRIISMSLGGSGPPSGPTARLVDEYARQGVIFVIAAGNERGTQSIESPSDAPGALTVGSLNVDGRMSDYTSFGLDFDTQKLKYVVKDVFMTPGQNIRSTLPGGGYGTMSGTSMATPALSGVVALLEQASSFNPAPDPVTASQRIVDALRSSSAPMNISTLPPDVSLAQNFLVVDPVAALNALRAQQNAVVGK